MANADDILIRIEGNDAEFRASMRSAENILRDSTRKMQTHLNGIDKSFANVSKTMGLLKTGIAGLVAGVGIGTVAKQFYEVNKEFQDLMAGLRTATGSQQAADAVFASLRQFAQETPYDLAQVVTAFIKLKNLGLDPSIESMRAYGDIAAAMPGKTLDQFVEAVADAVTGEFERLKEFGIKASSQGDQVKFTFRGMTTEVKKSAGEIEDYLRDLARVNFGGAMADKMNTIGGAASNLKDALDNLFITIGKSGSANALVDALNAMAAALNRLSGVTSPFAWGDDLEKIRARVVELKAQIAALGSVNPFDVSKWRALGTLREELEKIQKLDAQSTLEDIQQQIAKLEGAGARAGQPRVQRRSRDEELDGLIAQEAALKSAIEARKKAEEGGKAETKQSTPTVDPAEAKKIAGVIADLQLAYDNLGRSARDAYVATQLDKAGLSADDPRAQAVRDLAAAYYDAREAAEELDKEVEQMTKREMEQEEARLGVEDYIAGLQRQNEILQQNREIQAGLTAVAEQEAKARKSGIELTEEQKNKIEELANANDKLKERQQALKQLSSDLGSAIGTAFEDAVIEGKSFSDVLKALEKDLIRIILRMTVTKSLESAVGGAISGIARALGFADGGVMTPRGPLPLRKYATGGIANTPQMAVFGEGRMNEAYVPLPDGRTIPVTLDGGGGAVSYSPTIQIDARNSTLSAGEIKQIVMAAVGQSVSTIRKMQKDRGSARL